MPQRPPRTIDEVFRSGMPALASISREQGEAKARAVLVLIVTDALEFFNASETMNDRQVAVTVDLILEEYPYMQADDITARPEYKLLDKQVELNRQQVKLSRSELLPKIGIVGNYSYMNGLEINDQKVLDKGSFTAMLSVSVPVFHFGERKNKVNAAKAKLQQSLLEQSDQQELMLLQLTQAAHNLEEAQLECELADTSYQTQVDAHFRLYLAWIAHRQASGMLR